MKRKGVDEIFFAGTSLTEMAEYVKAYDKKKKRRMKSKPDLVLARKLTELEDAAAEKKVERQNTEHRIANSEHQK